MLRESRKASWRRRRRVSWEDLGMSQTDKGFLERLSMHQGPQERQCGVRG